MPGVRAADRLALLRRRIEEIERAPAGSRRSPAVAAAEAAEEGEGEAPVRLRAAAAGPRLSAPRGGLGRTFGTVAARGADAAAEPAADFAAGPADEEGRAEEDRAEEGRDEEGRGGTGRDGTGRAERLPSSGMGAEPAAAAGTGAGVASARGLAAVPRAPLVLGAVAVDAALGGGLARAALHEVAAARGGDPAAALGFSLGVAARAAATGRVLWVLEGAAAGEAGALYGPGLDGYGLPARRLVVVAVRRPVEALWAMEEGLRTPGLAAVVAELLDGGPADLTASRRLSLAARAGGGLGLLVLHRPAPGPSAAVTRWRAAAAAGPPDRHGGLGPPAATLALTRNRRGPCGTFTIEWDSHAGRFADLPAPRTLAGRAGDGAGHRGGADGEPRPDAPGEAGARGRPPAGGATGPHAGGVAAAAGDRPPRPQAA